MNHTPPTRSAGDSGPIWRLAPFDRLELAELDAIYRARQQVFVVEQQCIYLDVDGRDRTALHLLAGSGGAAGELLAYARILPPGSKYAEASIGRVLTAAAARGTGLGRALFGRAIEACEAAHPGHAIRISAQARLESFYRSFGFAGAGEPYDEDGILHLEMLRPAVGPGR